MMKKVQSNSFWFVSFLLIAAFSNYSVASVCEVLPNLSLEQCGHYDFIAFGKIESDLNCEGEEFSFYTFSVFKGHVKKKKINLYTSCFDNGLAISKGEYWILYGYFNNSQQIKLTVCGHSRKQTLNEEIDYQKELRGSTFQEDLNFLKENFSIKLFDKKELLPKKYEKIEPKFVPILLGIGLIFMIIGFFIMRKLK